MVTAKDLRNIQELVLKIYTNSESHLINYIANLILVSIIGGDNYIKLELDDNNSEVEEAINYFKSYGYKAFLKDNRFIIVSWEK